ncbi:hypothetical protein BV22DRAFT_1114438 [Leucogyrophana mollusca]|uniref:Uncharacterized protein n=1 Tax=Leucogyrophana mollusca TaxID=85980 RepID=A0ACB8B7K9_9AGAM|nr:hypothetical protein BV22DRAFT_1114438 [Leucogyrophana mollusca]
MSEYWVSHKKYFCKYCDIYITDDAPSKRQHENGLRHKGNVERFVRGLYKMGEKRKKDLEEEKREMQRIGKAAEAAYAQDVGSGLAKASGSGSGSSTVPVASTSKPAQKPPPKPSNPYANYTTAASLGYTDPDAERLQAEAERRRMQGVAGDWQVVESSTPTQIEPPAQMSELAVDGEGSRKREAPNDEEDERQFKLRKKTLGAGLGEIYDPGLIPIKLKAKKEEAVEDAQVPTSSTELTTSIVPADSTSTTVPKWTKIQWKRADFKEADDASGSLSGEGTDVDKKRVTRDIGVVDPGKGDPVIPKAEISDADPVLQSLSEPVKGDDVPASVEAPAPANLFRKRKVASNAAGSRGKREV